MKDTNRRERLVVVHREFSEGRRELMKAPGYEDFRVMFIRRPAEAERMLNSSPDCVLYAACMMSNAEMDYEACHDAANALIRGVKKGLQVGPALHVIAGVIMTDEFYSIRAKAAEILAIYAERGNDISKAYASLETAAAEDLSPEVRANAKRALEAANRIS